MFNDVLRSIEQYFNREAPDKYHAKWASLRDHIVSMQEDCGDVISRAHSGMYGEVEIEKATILDAYLFTIECAMKRVEERGVTFRDGQVKRL